MADDIPVDLFGDDDEDEDEEGEGFGYAEEDFVEVGADTPLAAEVANLKRPVWLAKVRRPRLRRTAAERAAVLNARPAGSLGRGGRADASRCPRGCGSTSSPRRPAGKMSASSS